jgi:presenilin-like A22 family membrane protease
MKNKRMKHSLHVTLLLLLIFVLAQLNGFFVLDYYIDIQGSALAGETVVDDEAYANTRIAPPEVDNESLSYIYIMIALLIGTALVLLLIKFKQKRLWKLWFFVSVVVTLIISLNSWMFRFFGGLAVGALVLYGITVVVCCVLAWHKVFRQNVVVHNVTEIFIYGGLAALIVPILNVFSVAVLMVLVAAYDAYAVWKSKHMVGMAKFQMEEKVFAGLYIPYSISSTHSARKKSMKNRIPRAKKLIRVKSSKSTTAVLGGGDVAFPLLFSGVIMKSMGVWWPAFVITATTTLALGLLFYFGEKGKFYPAIPFIAAGCFVGYGLVLLL